jgi:hypothetical protein
MGDIIDLTRKPAATSALSGLWTQADFAAKPSHLAVWICTASVAAQRPIG